MRKTTQHPKDNHLIHSIAQATQQHLQKHYTYTKQLKIQTTYSILKNWPTITEIRYYKNDVRIIQLGYNQQNIYHHQMPPNKMPLGQFLDQIKTWTLPYSDPNYLTELTNYTDKILNQWLQTNPTYEPPTPPPPYTKQSPTTSDNT
jgi:hypothetical protein